MKFHFSLNPKAVKTALIHEAQQSAGISQKQGQYKMFISPSS